jgi:hypothetical protein
MFNSKEKAMREEARAAIIEALRDGYNRLLLRPTQRSI